MNLVKEEASALLDELLAAYPEYNLSEEKQVVIAASFPFIHYCSSRFSEYPFFRNAAQNCSEHEEGAYTGEVSAKMLASLGTKYVIIGHSERRHYFLESDTSLLRKLNQVLKYEMMPIFCCGETLERREKEEHFLTIKQQLKDCVFQLSPQDFKNVVIAYEPVWAIGTGKTATPAQAQEMHLFIRKSIEEAYDAEVADKTTILYGGSVNAKNASHLFSCPDIDGGLVGGASLKADEFSEIIRAEIKQ